MKNMQSNTPANTEQCTNCVKQYDVTALGEVLIDFTYAGKSSNGQALFEQNAGGAPANVAVAVSKLGGQSAFVGKVGNDMHGIFLKQTLLDNGVNVDGMLVDDNNFTTLAFVSLSSSGERSFAFARKPGADTQLLPREIDRTLIANSKILHIGSLSMTDEPARSATLQAIKYAKSSGCIVSYDPNYRASLWQSQAVAIEQIRSLLKYADIVKISQEECILVSDTDNYKQTASQLIAQGVKVVVVTLGKDGAYVCTSQGEQLVSGFSANVVDTTGAGDSFWGGMLYQISRNATTLDNLSVSTLAQYAQFGNAVASICVEGKGAIPCMPTLDAVNKRLNANS